VDLFVVLISHWPGGIWENLNQDIRAQHDLCLGLPE
jgi:hypothetical protein